MPVVKKRVVAIPAVHHDDAAFRKGELTGDGHLVPFPLGDQREGREIAIMIQHQMQFDRPFRLPEFGPGEQG